MTPSTLPSPRYAVTAVTVSDRSSDGRREDESGQVLLAALEELGYAVRGPVVVPDGIDTVAGALRQAVALGHRLVVTTGGTEVRLPAVRARDLPAIGRASEGRIPVPELPADQ